MASTILREWMKDRLIGHAKKTVAPTKETAALAAAYKAAAPLVRKAVEAKYPPRDMKVLQRWQSSQTAARVLLSAPDGSVVEFSFASDEAPLEPSNTPYRDMFLIDAATAAAVEKWSAAHAANEAETKKRLEAYGALLAGSRYLEEVAAVWPEATVIIPKNQALIALNPEQIAVVKRDIRERVAA